MSTPQEFLQTQNCREASLAIGGESWWALESSGEKPCPVPGRPGSPRATWPLPRKEGSGQGVRVGGEGAEPRPTFHPVAATPTSDPEWKQFSNICDLGGESKTQLGLAMPIASYENKLNFNKEEKSNGSRHSPQFKRTNTAWDNIFDAFGHVKTLYLSKTGLCRLGCIRSSVAGEALKIEIRHLCALIYARKQLCGISHGHSSRL